MASKRQALLTLQACHVCHQGGGGRSHEGQGRTGGRKGCGPRQADSEKILEALVPATLRGCCCIEDVTEGHCLRDDLERGKLSA